MNRIDAEMSLMFCLLINALVVVPAWLVALRLHANEVARRWMTTLLLWYAGQYAITGICGVAGAFGAVGFAVGAALVGAALLGWWRRLPVVPEPVPSRAAWAHRLERAGATALAMLVVSYHLYLIYKMLLLPPTADDALIYHLPAAAQWLQDGRMGLYEAWYHNPANTYSPLGGSQLLAWWMAPLGNDALARFAQAPAVLLACLAMYVLARRLGAGVMTAALVALALGMARPVVSQSTLAKDDLFLLAFFLCALVGLTDERRSASGSVLGGIAAGLMLSMKYTSVYALLPLALAMPMRRWDLRHAGLALAGLVVFAGPWYGRNLVEYGNAVYPLGVGGLPGFVHTQVNPRLESVGGVMQTLLSSYYGLDSGVSADAGWLGWVMRPSVWIGLGWIAGSAWMLRRASIDGLRRAVLVGPAAVVTAFVLTSPFAEARFCLPALPLLLLATALLPGRVAVAASVVIALVCAATSFSADQQADVVQGGLMVALLLTPVGVIMNTGPIAARSLVGGAGALVALGAIYVNWNATVRVYREAISAVPLETDAGVREVSSWQSTAGEVAQAWVYVRDEVPEGKAVCVINTPMVYPLMGFELDRRVVCVPPNPRLRGQDEFAPSPALAGEDLVRFFFEQTNAGFDAGAWVERLRARGVSIVFVRKSPAPPETLMSLLARGDAFVLLYQNSAAAVYRLK